MLSKNGEIRRDEYCIDYTGRGSPVTYECHGSKGNQLWKYNHEVNFTYFSNLNFIRLKNITQMISNDFKFQAFTCSFKHSLVLQLSMVLLNFELSTVLLK